MKKILDKKFYFLTVLSGSLAGLIGGRYFELGTEDFWPSVAPALLFGVLTSWFVFRAKDKFFLRALFWVVLSCIIFYTSVMMAVFWATSMTGEPLAYTLAGLYGGFLLSLSAHFLFKKSSTNFKVLTALIGGFVSILVMNPLWGIGYEPDSITPLFVVWQAIIGSRIFFSLTKNDESA